MDAPQAPRRALFSGWVVALAALVSTGCDALAGQCDTTDIIQGVAIWFYAEESSATPLACREHSHGATLVDDVDADITDAAIAERLTGPDAVWNDDRLGGVATSLDPGTHVACAAGAAGACALHCIVFANGERELARLDVVHGQASSHAEAQVMDTRSGAVLRKIDVRDVNDVRDPSCSAPGAAE